MDFSRPTLNCSLVVLSNNKIPSKLQSPASVIEFNSMLLRSTSLQLGEQLYSIFVLLSGHLFAEHTKESMQGWEIF